MTPSDGCVAITQRLPGPRLQLRRSSPQRPQDPGCREPRLALRIAAESTAEQEGLVRLLKDPGSPPFISHSITEQHAIIATPPPFSSSEVGYAAARECSLRSGSVAQREPGGSIWRYTECCCRCLSTSHGRVGRWTGPTAGADAGLDWQCVDGHGKMACGAHRFSHRRTSISPACVFQKRTAAKEGEQGDSRPTWLQGLAACACFDRPASRKILHRRTGAKTWRQRRHPRPRRPRGLAYAARRLLLNVVYAVVLVTLALPALAQCQSQCSLKRLQPTPSARKPCWSAVSLQQWAT
ncbi:hypothetical protein CC78DRAFT_617673 [Lojkania enalia]|uniref:Uncharacterized protein n=1 Tax=Lojkania enalia TaxID=147567 RepID=A0A9P4N5J4_9PLEO|nr:hypothetical protein CC78DRAFT_617673 [Didymosphaeria enalia]